MYSVYSVYLVYSWLSFDWLSKKDNHKFNE